MANCPAKQPDPFNVFPPAPVNAAYHFFGL